MNFRRNIFFLFKQTCTTFEGFWLKFSVFFVIDVVTKYYRLVVKFSLHSKVSSQILYKMGKKLKLKFRAVNTLESCGTRKILFSDHFSLEFVDLCYGSIVERLNEENRMDWTRTLFISLRSVFLLRMSVTFIPFVEETFVSVGWSKYLLKHLGHERTFLVQFTVYPSKNRIFRFFTNFYLKINWRF